MPVPAPLTDLPVDAIALGSAELWARPDREEILARLRRMRWTCAT